MQILLNKLELQEPPGWAGREEFHQAESPLSSGVTQAS